MIGIDEETFSHLNKSSETALRVPKEYGGGYLASLEVTHQLHCLVRIADFLFASKHEVLSADIIRGTEYGQEIHIL